MSLVLLTPSEAAKTLHVALNTLQNWRVAGVGPRFMKLNNKIVRYRLDDVEAWVAEQAAA